MVQAVNFFITNSRPTGQSCLGFKPCFTKKTLLEDVIPSARDDDYSKCRIMRFMAMTKYLSAPALGLSSLCPDLWDKRDNKHFTKHFSRLGQSIAKYLSARNIIVLSV